MGIEDQVREYIELAEEYYTTEDFRSAGEAIMLIHNVLLETSGFRQLSQDYKNAEKLYIETRQRLIWAIYL